MEITNYEKNQLLRLEFKYKFENYFYFEVFIANGDFSGKSTFGVERSNISDFYNNLKNNVSIAQEIIINDYDSDNFISIRQLDILGHFILDCQVGGSHRDSFLKTIIECDLLGLEKILNFFNNLINPK